MFAHRLGYVLDDTQHEQELKLSFAGQLSAPASHDSGFRSEPIVQSYSDCVPCTVAKSMQKRAAFETARTADAKLPARPSARWGYWQWLESQGALGNVEKGTQPYAFMALLNKRGWCTEEHMPYLNPDGSAPGMGVDDAPSIAAFRHAHDQKGKLLAHDAESEVEMRLAIVHDLAVGLPFACDKRIVMGDIPNDPDYVWDFDDSSPVVGWHMIEAVAYDERGVLCQNTWGTQFGWGGYVRIGWRTLRNPSRAERPLIIDHVALTSDE